MTLDTIIEEFQAGTLANESDLTLHDAQTKINIWHSWRQENPTAKPNAVPSVDLLQRISDFIQSTITRRYGCND